MFIDQWYTQSKQWLRPQDKLNQATSHALIAMRLPNG